MSKVEIYPDAKSLAAGAAEFLAEAISRAIVARGRCTIVLSGGNTPRETYRLLAQEYGEKVEWQHVYVFWGDERAVGPASSESNFRMAREALLDRVPIPTENIHRIQAELGPEAAADLYEATLRAFFATPIDEDSGPAPRFDLVLLGLGDNGHTASLFPNTTALHERTRWAVAQYVEELTAWRITLTPPAINAAAEIVFLVAGKEKAVILHQVLNGPHTPDHLPAQLIKPDSVRLHWLLDADAAAML